MATLETTFAGLKLKNPIIISSSGLTDSAAKNQKLYEAGAGAIVLKSLFEEQIMMEADWLGDPNMYPEGSDYLVGYIREHKLGEYLNLIKETKKVCDIPVIASRPAVTNAIAIPCIPLGIFTKLNCSRIPANNTIAKAKPRAVEKA